MPQAVTNLVKLGMVREATIGTTPATPKWLPMRFNGAQLAGKPVTVISAEIISDRMVGDLPLVGKNADGSLDFEWSYFRGAYGGLDLLLEGGLCALWSKSSEKDNFGTADSVITDVAAAAYTTTAVSPAWARNQLVLATGFTNAANNGLVKAGIASSSTSLVTSAKTAEAAPPAAARLKVIGLEAQAAADIQTTTVGNKITSTVTDFTTFGLVVGQWVKAGTTVGGDAFSFATAANNGWYRISAILATSLTCDVVPTGFATDTAAGKTIRLFYGDVLRNGTTTLGHSFEQQHPDLTAPAYQYMLGGVVDAFNLVMTSQALVKGTASIKAMSSNITTTRFVGSTDNTVEARDVMNSSSNVARIAEAGTALATPVYAMELSMDIANNVRQLPGIGQIGFVGINLGRQVITGSAKFYFGDTTILAKAIANTATSLDWAITDSSGYTYQFDLPKVKLATAQAVVGGLDQDIMVDCTYNALRYTNPASVNYQVQVQRCEQVGVATATI
jgi:hypothetical protein